jgi:3-oxoacyl-[acyl-carrier protein] reductase
MNIDGCVAVVTGGNGGLGRVIAETLAREGAHLALVCESSIDETRMLAERLMTSSGQVRAAAFVADVGEPESVEQLHHDVLESFGAIDILVNNAAYNQWIPFTDLEALTPEVWEKIMRTNCTGPFLTARAFAPSLRAGSGGRIVNVSSIAGFDAQGSSIAYAVSKAALNHLTRCLSVAFAPDVLVNGVAPGYMEGTRMSSRLPPERVAESIGTSLLRRPTRRDDVAEQVVAFVRSDSTTGQTVCVDAGRHLH